LIRLAMQGELTRLWQRRGFTVLMVTHDVEALLLSNRVIVFSDRPARLSADLAVDLLSAAPRSSGAAALATRGARPAGTGRRLVAFRHCMQ
jgi:ABC-type nitrate/sulfonate/bicarbonate transport system ATPase subunit